MAKMNGVKKFEKTVTHIMQECTGINDFYCKLGANWVYYNHKSKVEFSLLTNDDACDTWLDWINERYDFETDNLIMLSMLHEIGHHVTLNDFIEEDLDRWDQEVKDEEEIEMALANHLLLPYARENLKKAYHSLPAEVLATEWAIGFWRNNRKRVEKAFKRFCKAAIKFYAANGLDENGNELEAA